MPRVKNAGCTTHWRRALARTLMLSAACLTPTVVQSQDEPIAAAPYEPVTATGRVERTLRQYDALVADEAWDEAIELLGVLEMEHGSELVPIRTNVEVWRRYETVSQRRQRLLAALPEEGLRAYRRRVARSVERMVDEGVTAQDETALRRVAEEYAAAEGADRALLALCDIALERGDTTAARRWLGRIRPVVWGPYGEPAAVALAGYDLSADPQRLAEVWAGFERPDDALVCPSAEVDAATVLTRLVYASVLDGDHRRAEIELELLEAIAPQAEGRIAGKQRGYAATLRPMVEALAEALAESSPGREQSALNLDQWAWDEPLQTPISQAEAAQREHLRRLMQRRGVAPQIQLGGQIVINNRPVNLPKEAAPPIVMGHGGTALFADEAQPYRVDLEAGRIMPIAIDEIIGFTEEESESDDGTSRRRIELGGIRIQINQQRVPNRARALSRAVSGSHAVHGGVFYGVQSYSETKRGPQGIEQTTREMLYGLDLESDLKLIYELGSEQLDDESQLRFAGAPAFYRDRVLVAVNGGAVGSQLSLACFTRDGRRLWRTPLGSGAKLTSRVGGGVATITLGADTAYVLTNLGAVAAVALDDGRVRWLSRYERVASTPADALVFGPQGRPPAVEPGVLALKGDRLFAVPDDSPNVFALDATTGRVAWIHPSDDPTAALLGVEGDSLIVAGRRLAMLDPLSGEPRRVWPESDHAGIRGMGRGLLIDGEVFWPTRDTLYVFDARTGAMSRAPIDTSVLGLQGVNLAIAGDRLVLAGGEGINALGDSPGSAVEPTLGLSRLMDGAHLYSRTDPAMGPLRNHPNP